MAKSRKPVAELLMDQTMFAGVGNIFRAELLYRARVSPFRLGKDVEEKTLRAIWKDAVALMPAAMIDRRIVTTKPANRPHKTWACAEGRGSLCVSAQWAALLRLRDGGEEDGDGGEESVLVSDVPGGVSYRRTR